MNNIDAITNLYAHKQRNFLGGQGRIDRERENKHILLSFAKSIQERDIVTYDHSRRVATYAQRLARYVGWSRRDARDLALAALVHDLGKTWIANDILLKANTLSDEERRKMERHPVIGARILTVADVYDVLTSQRPYKEALSKDAARERLLSGSAASFDPMIVRAFLNLLDSQPHFTLPQRICAIPSTAK